MKILRNILIFTIITSSSFIACERQSREQGGKNSALQGTPNSSSTPSDATIVASTNVAEVAPNRAPEPIDGKALYTQVCAVCHQANGQGVPVAFPPLDGSPYVNGDQPEKIEKMAAIMIYGLKGPIKVKGADFNSMMLPQGQLSNEQLAAVATFVRSSWSNKSGPVAPSVFAKMRAKWGNRIQFEISELGAEE